MGPVSAERFSPVVPHFAVEFKLHASSGSPAAAGNHVAAVVPPELQLVIKVGDLFDLGFDDNLTGHLGFVFEVSFYGAVLGSHQRTHSSLILAN